MKKILTFFAIFLISCGTQQTDVEDIMSNITYFKDPVSNLCFAAIDSKGSDGYYSTSITCVPCDSVKNLIKL